LLVGVRARDVGGRGGAGAVVIADRRSQDTDPRFDLGAVGCVGNGREVRLEGLERLAIAAEAIERKSDVEEQLAASAELVRAPEVVERILEAPVPKAVRPASKSARASSSIAGDGGGSCALPGAGQAATRVAAAVIVSTARSSIPMVSRSLP
jgi:hypothetical protein